MKPMRTVSRFGAAKPLILDRKSTRLNSSHMSISYAVFCLKKKSKTGIARVQCNDGADAEMSFNALSMLSGYGYGRTSRGPVSFTYRLEPEVETKYLALPAGKRVIKAPTGPAFKDATRTERGRSSSLMTSTSRAHSQPKGFFFFKTTARPRSSTLFPTPPLST